MNKALYAGRLLTAVLLSDYTTWRVGGIAKQLYRPLNLTDLIIFIRQINRCEPIIWLGLGSNCLIRDYGINGTVIVTQGGLKDLALISPNLVRVEAGVSCAQMARFCARNALVGGEFWAGIPGTMGGALRMNAGCYGGDTWSLVVTVETVDIYGNHKIKAAEEFTVAYRYVVLPQDEWFVAATFKLPNGDKASAFMNIKNCLDNRAQTQPTSEYNCGSVFKNPPNDFAARLIESSGLKGKSIGNAEVSAKHANFIINKNGGATATEIETLIEFVQETVYQQTAVRLEREIHIIGDIGHAQKN